MPYCTEILTCMVQRRALCASISAGKTQSLLGNCPQVGLNGNGSGAEFDVVRV